MKEYIIPAGIDQAALRLEADRRRAALVAAGCATYVIGWREGQQRITCLCCGLGTSNSHDVREKYCGMCRTWHAEWIEREPSP